MSTWPGSVCSETARANRREDGGVVRIADELIGYVRQQTPEFAKFCMVGAMAFTTTDAGSNVLHFQARLGPLTSNTIATIAGTGVAFLGNRYWTFRRRQRTGVGKEGLRFLVLNGLALLIQLACIGFGSYVLSLTSKLGYNIALLVGIGLAMLFRFWSYRKWVWAAPAPTTVRQAPAEPHVHA